MKSFLLLVFIFVVVLAQASAQNTLTYPANTDIVIAHSVRFNGAPVNANCNITVFNPVKIVIVPFSNMSFNQINQTYDFVIQKENITLLNKIYQYDVTCLTPSANATDSFYFVVTEDGTTPTVTEGLAYFFLLIVGISLFIYTLYSYRRIETANQRGEEGQIIKINKKKYLKMFLFAMLYFLLAWVAFITWTLAAVYINSRTVAAIFYGLHIGMLKMILPFSIVWLLVMFIQYLRDLNLEKKVQRGDLLFYGK